MALLPYDVNSFIKTHSAMTSLLSTLGVTGTLDIVPLNEPEPCNAAGTPLARPFLRYFWMPNIVSANKYFIRRDRVRYYVMDRDFDRNWQIANTLVKILGNPELRGNPHKIPCSDGANRIFYSTITASNSTAPNEVNGLAQTMLEFEIKYTTSLL